MKNNFKSKFKNKLWAFTQLARFDKPAGFLLLMWPCFWAIILSAHATAIIYYLIVFLIGSIVMRGAGCVVNDLLDRNIDAQVERTKTRPLPSGRVTVTEALAFLYLLMAIGFTVFVQLNFNAESYSVGAFLLALIYPLMKRLFSFPQLFLGIVFSSGALVAWAAASGNISFPAFLLYVGCIFWTVGYDTIYGFQDIKNDLTIGVKSTAITFGKNSKQIIFVCFVVFYLLVTAAVHLQHIPYAFLYTTPAFLHILYVLKTVNLADPADCMKSFKRIAFITGFLLFIGLYSARLIN